jgi:hypothetical protein
MTPEEHQRFIRLARYYCQQELIYRTSKCIEIKGQAKRQMEAVDKEQLRLLETEKQD